MQLKLKMEIRLDKKNDLLKRREVKVIMHSVGNPGYSGAKNVIDEQFKASPEVTVINEVKSKFGRDTFLIDAFIYDSVEDRNKFHTPEEKPVEEAPVEQTASEVVETPKEVIEESKEETDKGGNEQ